MRSALLRVSTAAYYLRRPIPSSSLLRAQKNGHQLTLPLISTLQHRRTLVPAPKPNSGPLMEYRSDRELPDPPSLFRIWRSLPIFIAILVVASFGIFNYQKLNSSVVTSSLYALRTHDRAREILGDEIYFAHKVPWIWGTMNQLHGKIDIQFWVKGTKSKALMRFASERKHRMGFFQTTEWNLKTVNGDVIQLLEDDRPDPFMKEKGRATEAIVQAAA